MPTKREARVLKANAIASLKRSIQLFNSFDDDGRVGAVLRDLQHAFEMLLKAGLVLESVEVFDKQLGRSISFKKATNYSTQHLSIDDGSAGLLRAIEAMRDDQQHWHATVDEGILYAHLRAGVTLFDEVLHTTFKERLADHLPRRVLPLSTEPPQDIQVLIDEEYSQIVQLLQPGRRRSDEARARIRSLLALEAHVTDEVLVSKQDVARVERAISSGANRGEVFPVLRDLRTDSEQDGIEVKVRFVKSGGLPVTYTNDDENAAAVREVDLQARFHLTTAQLADAVGLTQPKCLALRRKLGIDEDPSCRHVFTYGKVKAPHYSDNAVRKMNEALATVDMDEVWRQYGPRRKSPEAQAYALPHEAK